MRDTFTFPTALPREAASFDMVIEVQALVAR